MPDTLEIAESLQEGQDGLPPAQARQLARAIAEATDDKRLEDLGVKVGVRSLALRGEFRAASPAWTSASPASSAGSSSASTRSSGACPRPEPSVCGPLDGWPARPTARARTRDLTLKPPAGQPLASETPV